MFCCSKPAHTGQIVTTICEQQHCIQKQTQLCCSQCIKQSHSSHTTTSMKKIMPDLLKANNQRKYYVKILEQLAHIVEEQFANDQYFRAVVAGERVGVGNVVEIVKLMLLDLKKRNKEENKKIREIQKTLKINNQDKNNSPAKYLQPNYQSVLIKPSNSHNEFGRASKNFSHMPLSNEQMGNLQTFSHSLKHAYITLSPDMHSAVKSSQAGGYKLAALSASPIPYDADNFFFNVKIVKSSGNIHVGLGIPEIIRQKQYLNCYGAGQGTFLIGQNGNDPINSILFHHSDNVFNRKQIVGWNFKQGQVIGVGVIKQDGLELISFRKYQVGSGGKIDIKKTTKQFTMPLSAKGAIQSRLHLVVLLQSINDQVEILPMQQ